MASTIVTKNSSTASAVPVTGDLTQGELAVNVTDKKLYTKDSGGTVVKLVGGLGNQEANAVAITGGSINGTTVGATTASTGAFTTLSASSTTTLSGGTANGVAYLNGSKVVTTGSALTFDGSTFGVTGATTVTGDISTTSTGRLNLRGSATGVNNDFQLDNDDSFAYFRASRSNAVTKGYVWYLNNSTTEAMRLTSTGLGIGTSSPLSKLDVRAASAAMGNYQTIQAFSTDSFAIDLGGGISLGGNYAAGTVAQFASIAGRKENSTSGNYAGYLSFGTNSQATGVREVMRLDSSGNLGLGVTPSASNIKTFEVGALGNIVAGNGNNNLLLGANVYYNAGYKYAANQTASLYQQNGGYHFWYNAASGTAGNAITFTQAMTLDASGNLGVGTTSLGSFRFKAIGTGGNLSGNAYYVGLVGEGAASNKGVGFGYDSSSQTGVIYSETASSASNLAFWTYSGSAWGERARIDSSGNLIQSAPSTAPTLSTNGTMVFNLTSNTNLRVSVRGSDGVTRTANLTLA